jgi:hypothetical protein
LLPLSKFVNQDVYLTLPKGLHTSDIKYLSVWNRQYEEDFGHVDFQELYSSAVQRTTSTKFIIYLLTLAAYLY